MTEIKVHRGDVIVLEGPDGDRTRHLVCHLTDKRGTRWWLSDHLEGSHFYDKFLDEKTVLTLKITI